MMWIGGGGVGGGGVGVCAVGCWLLVDVACCCLLLLAVDVACNEVVAVGWLCYKYSF